MSSLVWAAAGAVIAVAAARLRVGTWNDPGAGFLPLITGLLLFVLGGGVFVQESLARRQTGAGLIRVPPATNIRLIAVAVGVLFAYAVLLERAGFIPVTFTFMLFALRVLGGVRWPAATVVALLGTAGAYGIFALWLRVPLPPWPSPV
jgi:hypothetical protein